MDHAGRRDRLRERLEHAGVDALLVTRAVNIRYLTGFTGSSGSLLVAADSELLVTDGRYAEQAAAEVPDAEILVTRGDGWLTGRAGGLARLGVESHALAWDRARAIADLVRPAEGVPAPRHVDALRQPLDDDELAALAEACRITVATWEAALGWLAPGMTELAVARRLRADLVDRGADDESFPLIGASGPNSARPHHRPSDRVLQDGDVVLVDFGGEVGGYHADMTRVAALGRVDDGLSGVYEAVAAANSAGVAAARNGVEAGAVDAACRDLLTAGGYGDRFVHPTGHAVGLEVHEAPVLRAGSTARLGAGMTVTVEPGVYLPGAGGVRIEDVVAITADGADILTDTPRTLTAL
jgi:Xaa-Pro aminopeptidase